MLPPCLAMREHRTADGPGARHRTATRSRSGSSWRPAAAADAAAAGELDRRRGRSTAAGSARPASRSRPTCRWATTRCGPASGDRQAAMPLIVTPAWLGLPERMGERRAWGLATQLYSVRSRQSWGVGDLADLEDLAVWSAAEHGADYVLVNPLHAAEPVAPMEPSPYLPTTRRFANPLYLRLERIPEYALAHRRAAGRDRRASGQARRCGWPGAARSTATGPGRPSARRCKIIFAVPRTPGRRAASSPATAAARARPAATSPPGRRSPRSTARDFADWPAELQHPASPAVRGVRRPARRRDRLPLLAAVGARRAAGRGHQAGPAGRDGARASCTTSRSACIPHGADAWGLQDTYAGRASPSARRPTRTTRTARTGASRRGGRTGWPSTAYAPFREHGLAPSCGTPAGSGSTT